MMLEVDAFEGVFPALVTPFDGQGRVSAPATAKLVERMIEGGASGLVPIGGTGEYSALSMDEREAFTSMVVEAADGRVPVVAGIVSTGFADSVEAGRRLMQAGADALMLVTPYYAMGTQEGIRQYFRAFRDTVDLPLVLYEIPGRTNVAMRAETVQAMAEDGSIIAMKYSSYDMPQFIKVVEHAGAAIAVMSGEEPLFATHVSLGARGGVLATANVTPRLWVRIFELARGGDLAGAIAGQHELAPLLEAVFAEMNPGPLKHAMALSGLDVGAVRLPLLAPGEATRGKLEAAVAAVRKLEDALFAAAA
jgi:4-hydroxy-tetrahydrodipicolinate synthase